LDVGVARTWDFGLFHSLVKPCDRARSIGMEFECLAEPMADVLNVSSHMI